MQKTLIRIQNETQETILKIISDRGSEFTSTRAEKFYLDNKILHETSAPHTPANGLIERDNRTVAEAMRSMLFGRSLPEKFWAEAGNTAVYLLNRSVASKHQVTPFELFHKQKPRVNHLRVFGCVAYVKIPEKKRSGWQRKLDPRSKRMIFVGYEQNFTYRLYDPEADSVIVSREVYFDEHKKFDFEKQTSYLALDNFFQEILSEHSVGEDLSPIDSNQPLTQEEIGQAFNDTFASASNDTSTFEDTFGDENAEIPMPISPEVQQPRYNLRSRQKDSEISVSEALTVIIDEPLTR